MPSVTTITTAIMAGLLLASSATATFTNSCRSICLASDNPNYLVTECLVSGGDLGNPNDQIYQWAEFNLNELLAFQDPNIVYQQDGNFAVNNSPCDLCSIATDATLSCVCRNTVTGISNVAQVDLNTWISDATGLLCFANNDFGPVCGPASSRRC